MKVVVCVWNFFGGGAERVAVLLANSLANQGASVRIYYSKDDGPNKELVAEEVEMIRAPYGGPVRYLHGLMAMISDWRPDVIQSHQTTRNVLAILAHLLSPGRSRRIVVPIEHGEMQETSRHKGGSGLRLFFLLARILYPLADRVVCVSDNVRASVVRHLSPFSAICLTMNNPVVFSKMEVLKNQPPDHPWLIDAKSIPVVVSLGRLESQKNYSLLLDAFALLRRHQDCRLVIFGDGSLRSELSCKIIQLGLDGAVDLPGYAKNPFAVLRAADLFVLSSNWEGLPTVAIEALACGVPVVSTDNSSGVREIVRNELAGELVPCGDAQALAGAMRRVLTRTFIRHKLDELVSDYQDSTVAREHVSLYENLLHDKAKRRIND